MRVFTRETGQPAFCCSKLWISACSQVPDKYKHVFIFSLLFFLSLWSVARIVFNSLYMVIFELYCPHGCITKTIKKRVHNKCFQIGWWEYREQIGWWEYRGLWFYVVLRQAGILFLQHNVDRHDLLYVIKGGSMEYEYWSRLVHLLVKAILLLSWTSWVIAR